MLQLLNTAWRRARSRQQLAPLVIRTRSSAADTVGEVAFAAVAVGAVVLLIAAAQTDDISAEEAAARLAAAERQADVHYTAQERAAWAAGARAAMHALHGTQLAPAKACATTTAAR